MIYISPSMFAADFANLGESIKSVEQAGAEYLHVDVMDGMFVPNISFGTALISSIRRCSKLIFDVHLMIMDPIRYIDDFVKAGADIITFHLESCDNPDQVIDEIRRHEVRVGMAISPETPVEKVLPFLPKLDMVLVMTVVPGRGGQKFMPDMTGKIRTIRRCANAQGLKLDIEVDGGISAENTSVVTEAGANVLVAGSAIFNAKRPSAVIAAMREAANANPYRE